MPLKFGTSGVRGLVTELTQEEVYLFVKAFLLYAKSINQLADVAIGYDLRDSSPAIQRSALKAIADFNLKAFDCGTIPTPALAYYAQQKNLLAVMITGSHIPADRNGIKFYLKTGETLKNDEQAIFKIYETLKTQPIAMTDAVATAMDARSAASEAYVQRYTTFFKPGSLSGLKVLFYQHSSVARDLFPEILEKLGAEVLRIGKSDTFIPVDTEAIDSLGQFRKWLLEHNADALISTDGDGDRPLFVDGKGEVLPGDKIGALTCLYLGTNKVAFPVSCNSGIAKMDSFKTVRLTKIGSPFVIEALNELSQNSKDVAGFEANGGFLLQTDVYHKNLVLEKLPTRDAVLPVLSVMSLAKQKGLKVFEVSTLLPAIYTASGVLKNFPLEKSADLLGEVSKNPQAYFDKLFPQQKFQLINVDKMDGLRCSFKGDTIIHLRPSGNAPEFRCYTEANSPIKADELCQGVLGKLF